MSWVFKPKYNHNGIYEVGFFKGESFVSISDFDDYKEAARWCNYLNGGAGNNYPDLAPAEPVPVRYTLTSPNKPT